MVKVRWLLIYARELDRMQLYDSTQPDWTDTPVREFTRQQVESGEASSVAADLCGDDPSLGVDFLHERWWWPEEGRQA